MGQQQATAVGRASVAAPGWNCAEGKQQAPKYRETRLPQYPGLAAFPFGSPLQSLSLDNDPDPPVSVYGIEAQRIDCVLGIAPEVLH